MSERDNRRPRSFDGAEWREALWRELDQIHDAIAKQASLFQRTLEKLEERDERRDEEISELRLQVSTLRNECRRNFKRDAGLASVPTVLVAAFVAAIQYVTQAHPTPPPLPKPPAELTAPPAQLYQPLLPEP